MRRVLCVLIKKFHRDPISGAVFSSLRTHSICVSALNRHSYLLVYEHYSTQASFDIRIAQDESVFSIVAHSKCKVCFACQLLVLLVQTLGADMRGKLGMRMSLRCRQRSGVISALQYTYCD